MFSLFGKVVGGVVPKEIKSGDRRGGQPYKQIQVMSQVGERASLYTVSDFNGYDLKIGDTFEQPVNINANHFSNRTSLQISTVRQS